MKEDAPEKTSFETDVLKVVSKLEIWAWYSYDAANSVFAIVLGMISSLLLTYLATDYACEQLAYGCNSKGNAISASEESWVPVFGTKVKPVSYASFILSLSVIFQALFFIIIGPLADYGKLKKRMLMFTATLGSLLLILQGFLAWSFTNWLAVGVLLIMVNILFGVSIICYNAFLPILAEHHPNVIQGIEDGKSVKEVETMVDIASNEMSAKGFAWGYIASVFTTIVILFIIIILTGKTTYNSGVVGKSNNDEDYQVDYRYNKAVRGFRVWSDKRSVVYGIQVKFDDLGWTDVIGSNYFGTLQESLAGETNYKKVVVYSHDGLLSGFRLYHDFFSEDLGNSSSSQIKHLSNPSKELQFGGLFAYLNNQKTKVQGVNMYWYNPSGIYDTTALGASLIFAGLWWMILTYLGIGLNFRSFPGKPIPQRNIFALSFNRLCLTLNNIMELPNLWKFMLAAFFWTDGISSFVLGATFFMVSVLEMNSLEIITCFIIANASAAAGNLLYLRIQTKFKLTAKQMFWIPLIVFIFLSIYPLFGFEKSLGFGLVSKIEVYIFSFIFGANIGTIQSYGRQVICNLIPRNKESEIFALYEISDKGSAWMGPLIMGILNQVTDLRYFFLYLLGVFLITVPIVWLVDVKEGRIQAGRTMSFTKTI